MTSFTRDQVLELIQLYKENPLLWNKTDKNYKNKLLREQVWIAIAEHMGVASLDQCKRKIKAIRDQLQREQHKFLRNKSHRCHWYAYKYLDFLKTDENKDNREDQIIKNENENSISNECFFTPGAGGWLTKTQVLKLIKLYKQNPVLWNPINKHYRRESTRRKAWKSIVERMGLPMDFCRRKIDTLKKQFRQEQKKILLDETYESNWYAYKHLEFLHNGVVENSENYQIEAEQSSDSVNDIILDDNIDFIDTSNENNSKLIYIEIKNNDPIELDNTSKNLKTEYCEIDLNNESQEIDFVDTTNVNDPDDPIAIKNNDELHVNNQFGILKTDHRDSENSESNLDENFDCIDTNNIDNSEIIDFEISKTNNKLVTKKVNNVKSNDIKNLQEYTKKNSTEYNKVNSKIVYPQELSVIKQQEHDEFIVYGETIAHRLKKIHNPKKICILKHKINLLLYEAVLESYSNME